MALIFDATLNPTKAEAIAAWLPGRAWAGEVVAGEVDLVGAFRFDDPDGEVGLETHLVRTGETLLQVPLAYRGAPVDGAEDALICEMDHSVLGKRWVYDGCADPAFVGLLAATTLTGVGQASAIHATDAGWAVAQPTVVLHGGGWTGDRIPVSGFGAPSDEGDWTVVRSPDLEVRLARRPQPGNASPGLTATWAGQSEPVLLATVSAG